MNAVAQFLALMVPCVALMAVGLARFVAGIRAMQSNNEAAGIRADALLRCATAELEESP